MVVARKLSAARSLNENGDSKSALAVAKDILRSHPDNLVATEIAMECYASLKQFESAADLSLQLANLPDYDPERCFLRAYDWHFQAGQYEKAIGDLRKALAASPTSAKFHRLMAQVLNGQGRRLEASVHVRELMQQGEVKDEERLSMVDLRGPFDLVVFGDQVDQSKVSLFHLGKARSHYAVVRGSAEKALALLIPLLEKYPDDPAVAAFYGRVLAENDRMDEYSKWLKDLPNGVEQQPEYWSSLGFWLQYQERLPESAHSFGQAILLDPTDRASLRELVNVLEALGESDKVKQLRQRLTELDKIFRIAKSADAQQAQWISETLYQHTRPWEAIIWLIHSRRLAGTLEQSHAEIQQQFQAAAVWERSNASDAIAQARQKHLIGFSLSNFPEPNLKIENTRRQDPQPDQIAQVPLVLTDIASTVGLQAPFDSGFPFDKIDEPSVRKRDMSPQHVNGGGVAVQDYDLDGNPDLYFSQAGGKPHDRTGSKPNQMYRLTGSSFTETTSLCGAADRGFGQGVSAGDVNQDGFPDLLVANIGENSIYINQGDGTFRRADELIAEGSNVWSSCLALADMNGDHLPEITEINYIDDPSAYQSNCDPSCRSPQTFAKADDIFYRCEPDGTFKKWALPSVKARLGFGVIIANFDRKHGNDCFIANDGDFNHFWSSTDTDSARTFSLIESANIRGCNIGRSGNSQACMGVAAGDFNRDGTLDLHVTNFYDEPSNLFLQTKTGFFSDEVRKYGLHKTTLHVLGFGTQAVDLDHDGWLDMCVLNGHVNDERQASNIPFQMSDQLFRGGERGFVLEEIGKSEPYWSEKQLGRALAVLDWNHDGRMDLVGTYLDRNVSLLENTTNTESNHAIRLELIGTTSERDANGAKVTVTVESQKWTAWQTGGDGYMCTNENVVHIGVAQSEMIDELSVVWPSGQEQTFKNIKSDARYLLIEGDELFSR